MIEINSVTSYAERRSRIMSVLIFVASLFIRKFDGLAVCEPFLADVLCPDGHFVFSARADQRDDFRNIVYGLLSPRNRRNRCGKTRNYGKNQCENKRFFQYLHLAHPNKILFIESISAWVTPIESR